MTGIARRQAPRRLAPNESELAWVFEIVVFLPNKDAGTWSSRQMLYDE
ncbi:hypothetical protein [Paraburkholderia atlantica]|nr:hypothetical protein [Paraburkholderia atlantica]